MNGHRTSEGYASGAGTFTGDPNDLPPSPATARSTAPAAAEAAGEFAGHEPGTATAVAPPPAPAPARYDGGVNPGDMVGVPVHAPADARPVTDQENLFEAAARAEAQADAQAQAEAEALLEAELAAASGSRWLSKTGAGALLLLLGSAILLVVLSQVASFVRSMSDLPLWAAYTGYAAMGVLLVFVLAALGRLALVYARLKASPVIAVGVLREMAARADLRRRASERMAEACKVVRDFVRTYPADGPANRKRLARLGFTPADLDRLRDRAAALTSGEMASPETFLRDCDQQFLAVLDDVARRRGARYAALVAVKTAALPSGLADSAVVLLNAYLLIGDLCKIYNLRTNRVGTVVVLAHVLVNAFTASHMEEWSQTATDAVMQEMGAQGGGLLAGIIRKVAPRAAEGTANYLLFKRLATVTIRRLRPLQAA